MTAPQITILALILVSLVINAKLHKKPKDENYNFLTSLAHAIILLSILYWGNFFN